MSKRRLPSIPSRTLVSIIFQFLQRQLGTHWEGKAPVLCIAARSGLDEAVANMLAQILVKHGIGARVEGADALSTANIFRLERPVAMVCVSFLNTRHRPYAFTIRRLRRKLPDVMIVLGSWNAETDTTVLADAVKADGVPTSLPKLCLEVLLCVAGRSANNTIVATKSTPPAMP